MSAESESVRKTENLPEWKEEEVDELVDFIEGYNSVGIVSVTGIPSRQLQAMRRDLYGSAALRMSRNTLMTRALEEVGDGFEDLTEFISGQVAFVGTNDNPFALYKQLEASKTPAPINAGEVAPNDIVIPEGDTGIDPGPFVGELQQVGASARIMDGSIKVTEDSTVLETGEEVSTELANVLSELGIEPKEVGLDLRSVYSEGTLFDPDDLDIDVEEYEADIRSAAAFPTDRSDSPASAGLVLMGRTLPPTSAPFGRPHPPSPRSSDVLTCVWLTEAMTLHLTSCVPTAERVLYYIIFARGTGAVPVDAPRGGSMRTRKITAGRRDTIRHSYNLTEKAPGGVERCRHREPSTRSSRPCWTASTSSTG
ncbi:50S ribosomal protein L10 [Halobium palmae]|uniref:Large ribosomal subunit protein uL10 n=1 Tax=Halobium palmae TaxID=1776492 RepID=A0ABD5RYB3_9EURY